MEDIFEFIRKYRTDEWVGNDRIKLHCPYHEYAILFPYPFLHSVSASDYLDDNTEHILWVYVEMSLDHSEYIKWLTEKGY